MVKSYGLIASIFVSVVLLLSPVRASEPETFRIGVCLSLSGDFSTLGRTYLAGVRIGAEDFNRRSAVTGMRIELIERDDGSDPLRGVAVVEELARQGVVAIIGSNATDVTLAMVEEARRFRVPLVTPSATSNYIGGNGDVAFRVLFNDDFQGVALARFMRRDLGLKRAALLVNGQVAYGRALVDSFVRTWKRDGGEVVADETYVLDGQHPDEYDFRPLLRRLKDAGPDFVVFPSYPDEVTAVLNQALDVGLRAIFCGGDTWQHESIVYASGNYLEGCYHIGYLDEGSDNPEMFTFMELLDRSNDVAAEPASVLGYDALELIITALLRVGGDRAAIIDGLYSIRNFPLASGDITIDRVEGTRKPAYIMKFERGPRGFERRVVGVIEP